MVVQGKQDCWQGSVLMSACSCLDVRSGEARGARGLPLVPVCTQGWHQATEAPEEARTDASKGSNQTCT